MTELIVGIVILIFVSQGGILIGKEEGHIEACKSVQLEWVKDKCMKVTREELK